MGTIVGNVRAEIRSLPLMFAKALGGIAAAAGFGVAVFLAMRGQNLAVGSPLTALVVGAFGLLVFVVFGWMLAKRASPTSELETTAERGRTSVLAWGLLILLALLFLGALAALGA
ncbi:MAG: hypothetical protein KKF85_12975 [Gammaproteobacteria bacterium]|nr:hypothetical protein [Rhodocyclaceae bacterium]MBU3909946.1 hypothetical protein [Gammaproteobacteria bacterium]MBU3990414.1 hypothetical protein [Gammaproteobacteria bacterium]MBU4003475.1 hypothetical protein [Gammaproteobacteria bacterium]MBU4020166.1 hypothetical protein [Gammaproteobacteria bacterium]